MGEAPQLRAILSHEDAVQAERFQREASSTQEPQIVPADLILGFARHGGIVLACFDKGRMIGLLIDYLASDEETPERVVMARLKHWSHLLLIHPEHAGQGLDFALRRAQRDLVIRQGVRLISWTDDPLDARRVSLSIRRLGAVCRKALSEEAPRSKSLPQGGEPAYRLLMDWWITSRRVASRVAGSRKALDLVHFLEAGARVANPAALRDDDLPTPAQRIELPDGNLVLVEIPPNLDALKASGRDLYMEWRLHIREVFTSLFDKGYLVVDFVLLGEERVPRALYLLSRGEATLG